ncbi:MAG: glutamate 5-kinase [Ponticaulis sp.]|nr:glutamate 5-kinase [Ponticaulis sp.]|tara:strand:+ start:16808 stop:17947 length:1140 start_codon:yes stop_codon:yes gene_type:complete
MTPKLEAAKRIVIKIGSSLILNRSEGQVRMEWMTSLGADVAELLAAGKEVLIVSSGAAALGRGWATAHRQFTYKDMSTLSTRQAASAIGQPKLMSAFNQAFTSHDVPVAQALLTLEDTERQSRWLNARATLFELMSIGVVPVINENDTVATSEIRYGDNDRLAARVAQMVEADLLILLSDIDGLYTDDPRNNPDAEHLPEINAVTPEIRGFAGGANSKAGVGTGGMATKLDAADIALSAGCSTVITLGFSDRPIAQLRNGGRATWILSETTPQAARRSWLSGHLTPEGSVTVDAGAEKALRSGASLLPVGITSVTGSFVRGAPIAVRNQSGKVIAKGVSAYTASEIEQIKGLQSSEVSDRLGYPARANVIHRDDMVVQG